MFTVIDMAEARATGRGEGADGAGCKKPLTHFEKLEENAKQYAGDFADSRTNMRN